MSEESFSFTNTGEPKFIVQEFVHEVAKTLRWVTAQCSRMKDDVSLGAASTVVDEVDYDMKLQSKVRQEKRKIWSSIVSWATHTHEEEVENTGTPRTSRHGLSKSTRPANEPQNSSPPRASLSTTDSRARSLNSLPSFHKEKVIAFLKRARAAYGRTALCLSGGAMMGLYHFGIVKALLEMGSLPNIISGTSAGSVVGAIVCTRTDEEIKRDLDPAILATKLKCFALPWSQRIKNLWTKGCMLNYEDWRELIRWFTCGDMTFAEAFKKTGRVFCITLCKCLSCRNRDLGKLLSPLVLSSLTAATTKKAPPVLINHITAPNVAHLVPL
jgi:hypothetical protein